MAETRVVYARVPEPLHTYLLSQASESGLSVARVLSALLQTAHDKGWTVRATAGFAVSDGEVPHATARVLRT